MFNLFFNTADVQPLLQYGRCSTSSSIRQMFNLFFNTADVQHFDVVDFIPDYVSPIVTIEYEDLAIDNKRRFYLPLLH
jgi:hypothetical protein